jgi:nucleotide-binding universal stress UspA family protein
MARTPPRRVVVGVDDLDNSLAAADQAVTEANLRDLPVLLLSARPDRDRTGPDPAQSTILRRIGTTWPDLRVSARTVRDDPAEALIAASRTAALVVVGSGGRDGRPGPGRVCTRVAAHAMSPTLVVPPDAAPRAGVPVLVGLGITPDDEPVIDFAFEEAALRRVPLLAVHVWSGIPDTAVGAVSPFAYDLAQAQAGADRLIAETLAGWAARYPDVRVERMPLYDVHPGLTLREASQKAGLVVVGARRYGTRSSQLLGTVPRTLIQDAGLPVAVVRSARSD